MAGIKSENNDKEVEFWKQEMELLSDQSQFSIYVGPMIVLTNH